MHAGTEHLLAVERTGSSARCWPDGLQLLVWLSSATYWGWRERRLRRMGGPIKGILTAKPHIHAGLERGPGGEDPYLDGGPRIIHLPPWRLRLRQRLDSRLDFWILADAAELVLSVRRRHPSSAAGAACTYSWPWVTPTGSTPIKEPSGSACGSIPVFPPRRAGTPGSRSCSREPPMTSDREPPPRASPT